MVVPNAPRCQVARWEVQDGARERAVVVLVLEGAATEADSVLPVGVVAPAVEANERVRAPAVAAVQPRVGAALPRGVAQAAEPLVEPLSGPKGAQGLPMTRR